MAYDKLQLDDEAHVNSACRSEITKYFSSKFSNGGNLEWLSTTNRYIGDASDKFKIDVAANPHTVDCGNLISYISASAPTHLIDGWSFYSRATEALLRGDSGAAIHLAYYAELRAAISILASEGIGVFDKKHPVVTSDSTYEVISKVIGWDINNSCHTTKPIGAGTHRIVWPLLKYWSTTPKASNLIDLIIKPEGIELSSWLSATKTLTSGAAIAEHLFSKLGIDLAHLHEDHINRNVVSYQPSDLRVQTDPPVEDVLQFVCETWRFLQPTQGGRFVDLEKILLKYVIQVSNRSVIDKNLIERGLNVSTEVATFYDLLFKDKSQTSLIDLSIANPVRSSPSYPMEILARAFLLLFVATGSVKDHFSTAGVTDFDFFWKRLLSTRLSFDDVDSSEDALTLWEDINEIIETTKAWVDKNRPSGTLGNWRTSNPTEANLMPSFELAAIWGLAA